MNRTYKTAKQWLEEHPAVRMLILMSATGKIVHWHTGTEEPKGKWCLLGEIP